ncbi:hypothetical protein [Mesorhizobium sp. 128a]
MRIPSGKTDQLIFFVALDSTDRVTRKTGLSSFTVYRSRNGGTATVYTTPTVAELSSANMPGVYSLTVDEDTTIASGSDSEEYCLHITCATMAPVTRTIELYRRDTTSGRTLDVSAGGEAGLDWANVGSPTTTVDLSNTTIKTTQKVDVETIKTNPVVNGGTATFPTNATLASTTNITAGTITTATNVTNAPTNGDLTATMKTSVTTAATAATPTAAAVTGAVGSVTGAVGSIAAGGISTSSFADGAITAAKFAANALDAVWSAATRVLTAGTNIALAKGTGVTGFNDPSAATIAQAVWDALTSALTTVGSVGKLLVDNVNATISSRSSHAASDIWAVGTRLLTAGTNIVLAKDTGVTGFNDLSAAQVNAEADQALADAGATSVRMAHLDADVSSRMASFSYSAPLDAAGTRSALGMASANLDTQIATLATAAALSSLSSGISASFTALATYGDVHWTTATGFASQTSVDDLPTNAEFASGLAGSDDAVLAEIAALTIPTAAANAAALLATAFEGAETVEEFLRLSRAALYGKANGLAGTTVHYRDAADTKNRLTATVDADGNRTAVTVDAS